MRHCGRTANWARFLLVVLLVILALGVRVYRARHLPIVAPDAIRYIEQGKLFQIDPLRAVREEVYHPLFSLAVVGVHGVLERVHPMAAQGEWGTRMQWVWAAQAISLFCGAVMAGLIVALSRQLGARFWHALAAGTAWALGQRVTAYSVDGMSDMLALCLFTGSMLVACRAMAFRRESDAAAPRLRGKAALGFLAAGVLAGLAYLTRPEGLAAPVIIVVTLGLWWMGRTLVRPASDLRDDAAAIRSGFKWLPRRCPRLPAMALGLALLLFGTALPAAPYMIAIRGITHKKQFFPSSETAQETRRVAAPLPSAAAMVPATQDKNAAIWVWEEVCRTFGYAPMAVLLVPLFWHRRLWGRPRLRLLVFVWAAVWYAVMFWLLLSYDYLNGRHTLCIEVLGFALLGIALELWTYPMRWWMDLWQRRPPFGMRFGAWSRWRGWPAAFTAFVFLIIVAIFIWQLPMPPWAPSQMLSQAAGWVRANVREEVVICDKQLLVGYYSVHPYTRWYGEPGEPHMDEVINIRAARRARTGREPLVMLGKLYENGKGVVLEMGNYRAVAMFGGEMPPSGNARGLGPDIYVLYALPGENIFKDGKSAVYLTSWPGNTNETSR